VSFVVFLWKKETITHFRWDHEDVDQQEQELHHSKIMNELSIITTNISSKTNTKRIQSSTSFSSLFLVHKFKLETKQTEKEREKER
jgi:hypothetical protein